MKPKTIKCDRCRVDVPLDKVDLPNRCTDKACPVPAQARALDDLAGA